MSFGNARILGGIDHGMDRRRREKKEDAQEQRAQAIHTEQMQNYDLSQQQSQQSLDQSAEKFEDYKEDRDMTEEYRQRAEQMAQATAAATTTGDVMPLFEQANEILFEDDPVVDYDIGDDGLYVMKTKSGQTFSLGLGEILSNAEILATPEGYGEFMQKRAEIEKEERAQQMQIEQEQRSEQRAIRDDARAIDRSRETFTQVVNGQQVKMDEDGNLRAQAIENLEVPAGPGGGGIQTPSGIDKDQMNDVSDHFVRLLGKRDTFGNVDFPDDESKRKYNEAIKLTDTLVQQGMSLGGSMALAYEAIGMPVDKEKAEEIAVESAEKQGMTRREIKENLPKLVDQVMKDRNKGRVELQKRGILGVEYTDPDTGEKGQAYPPQGGSLKPGQVLTLEDGGKMKVYKYLGGDPSKQESYQELE